MRVSAIVIRIAVLIRVPRGAIGASVVERRMGLWTNTKELITTRKIARRERVITTAKLRRVGIDVRECSSIGASRGKHKRRSVPAAPNIHPVPLPCDGRVRGGASAECECSDSECETSDDSGLQLSVHTSNRPRIRAARYRIRELYMRIACIAAPRACYRLLFAGPTGPAVCRNALRRARDSSIRWRGMVPCSTARTSDSWIC